MRPKKRAWELMVGPRGREEKEGAILPAIFRKHSRRRVQRGREVSGIGAASAERSGGRRRENDRVEAG